MLDQRRLRYFLTVVDEMHFGRAASRLRIAQPALSQQIKRLERDLDVTLFDRSHRRIELTEAGQRLADDGRCLLAYAAQVVDATQMAARGAVGTLRVGMVGTAVVSLLPILVRGFHSRFPDARLEPVEMPVGLRHIEAIRERRVDAGLLRYHPGDTDGVTVEPILEDSLVAVLPTDHPLAEEHTIDLGDLRDQTFVLWPRWGAPHLYDAIFSTADSIGFAPQIGHEALELTTLLSMVAAGLGVSLLPASVRPLTRAGVCYRDLDPPAPTSALAIAWRHGNDSQLLHSFLRVVRETFPRPS